MRSIYIVSCDPAWLPCGKRAAWSLDNTFQGSSNYFFNIQLDQVLRQPQVDQPRLLIVPASQGDVVSFEADRAFSELVFRLRQPCLEVVHETGFQCDQFALG